MTSKGYLPATQSLTDPELFDFITDLSITDTTTDDYLEKMQQLVIIIHIPSLLRFSFKSKKF